jgi:hypothetical protein
MAMNSNERPLDARTSAASGAQLAMALARRKNMARMAAERPVQLSGMDPLVGVALEALSGAWSVLDDGSSWAGCGVIVAPESLLEGCGLSQEQMEQALVAPWLPSAMDAVWGGERGQAMSMARCGAQPLSSPAWEGTASGGLLGELMLRASVAARRWAGSFGGVDSPENRLAACEGALASLALLISGMEGSPGWALAPDPMPSVAGWGGGRALPLDARNELDPQDEAGGLVFAWRRASFSPAALMSHKIADRRVEAEEIASCVAPGAGSARPRL